MAKRGEIDPWNVDVVDVADKFLKELEKARKLDLRISGRVLLYAAILVRMKSEILTNELLREEEKLEESEYEEEVLPPPDFEVEEYVIEDFEDEVIKSLLATGSRKKKLRRYTTLKDLIEELKRAEEKKRKRRKAKKGKEIRIDPLETPHEENVEEWIREIEELIVNLAKKFDVIPFSEIKGNDVVKSYISVLHLAFRRKLEVQQEKIFESEIYLRWINEGGN